nr:unnamed protein product [Callosobruchus analis]
MMIDFYGRKRSSLWKYFEILDDLLSKARCRLCDHELSYRTSTSNLKKHLLSKHPTTERITSEPRKPRSSKNVQIVEPLSNSRRLAWEGGMQHLWAGAQLQNHQHKLKETSYEQASYRSPLSMKEKRVVIWE